MTLSFPTAVEHPADARHLIRLALADVGPDVVEVAELLVSGLVTNALVHGSGETTLMIDVGESRVVVTVHDFDPSLDLEPLRVELTAEHGRGLAIVETLACSWGIERRSAGKAVWFELRL